MLKLIILSRIKQLILFLIVLNIAFTHTITRTLAVVYQLERNINSEMEKLLGRYPIDRRLRLGLQIFQVWYPLLLCAIWH